MILSLLFAIHLFFLAVIFTKKWQSESLSSAFINAALIIILFSVGWSVTGMIAKAIMPQQGLGLYFDRETFSLLLLTIVEYFFYKSYYSEKDTAVTANGTETQ